MINLAELEKSIFEKFVLQHDSGFPMSAIVEHFKPVWLEKLKELKNIVQNEIDKRTGTVSG